MKLCKSDLYPPGSRCELRNSQKNMQKHSYYGIDNDKLMSLREAKPWMAFPKYFKKVTISPSATVKMLIHGQSGFAMENHSKPVEVMGLLVGYPDPEEPSTIVITEAQPLPIVGMETRVVADDEGVINYMIALGEMNDNTMKSSFCGWYHTHPFEFSTHSHCFLSGTDVSTQLQWQRAEDPHGNPWVSVVIDPVRSAIMAKPEIMAFRVYPPEFSSELNEVRFCSVSHAT